MATPAKRALDFDQLEQKSRTDTISEAIKEVELTPVDDTKVNNTAEETCKKSPVNKGPKSKKLPTPATTSSTKAVTSSSGSSSSRRPATAPTRSSSLTSKITNGPIKTSEVKKSVVNLSSTSASKDAMTKSTSSSDSSSSTVVNTFLLKFANT